MTVTTSEPTGLFAPGLRALTIAGVTLVAVEAFEQVAVSTAMPTVAAALGGLSQYALAFGVPAAAGILGMVWAGIWSDRRGPVGALATGWLLFVVGLLISGSAQSMTMLICGRALQGLGTGLTTVALYVVVARTYPERLRPRVFSAYAAAWVLPALIGPAIAGYLVVHVGWRWVFLSVPFVAFAAALVGWGPCRRLQPFTDAADGSPTSGARKIAFAAMAGVAACLLSVAGQHRPAIARTTDHGRPGDVVPLGSAAVAASHLSGRARPADRHPASRIGVVRVHRSRGVPAAVVVSRTRPLAGRGRHRDHRRSAGLVRRIGAAGPGQFGRSTARPATSRILSAHRGNHRHRRPSSGTGFPCSPSTRRGSSRESGSGSPIPTLSVLTLELSAPSEEGRNTSALQVNDSLLQSITLAVSGTVFAALVARSHSAPYLAGFAIAASVAALGAILATRVRPSR